MKKIDEFLPLENFNGYYINKQGIILSKQKGTILRQIRPQIHSSGYLTVKIINNNGELEHSFVHRLVAETFIPNPNNLETVNHIDLDKKNNNANNLEWLSKSDNLKHFYKLSNKTSKVNCDLYSEDEYIGTFESIRKACIYVKENIEDININSMSNQVRVGVSPYKGKYTIKRL